MRHVANHIVWLLALLISTSASLKINSGHHGERIAHAPSITLSSSSTGSFLVQQGPLLTSAEDDNSDMVAFSCEQGEAPLVTPQALAVAEVFSSPSSYNSRYLLNRCLRI